MKRLNYASLTLIGLVILIAALRISQALPVNFAPVTALCLLGAAYFSRKWMAFAFPMLIMLLSDINLGWGRPVEVAGVYISYLLVVLMGFTLSNNTRPLRVFGVTIASSLLFFVITNFTCWIGSAAYTQDLQGFFQNYILALPYYRASFVSDLFFTTIFFTAFELIKMKFPKFALVK